MKNLVAKIEQSVGGRDIILILLSSFFYMSGPMMVTPLITGFSGSLGASATLMGLVGGLMNIVSLICRPFAGNLADKISKYKLSFIGAALMTVACFGYAISVNPGMILIARVINGIGYSCCSVCLSTWMSNLLPREKIGSGMGVYGMINALAMALAPALGVILFKNIGYKPAFIVATICAAITVLIIQFVKDKGEPAPKAATDQPKRFAILDINVVPIAIIMMLFTIPYCTTQSFLVSYIATRHLAVNISLYFPAYAVVLLILRLAARNLFDKKPFSFFMILSSISAFFGVLLLA
jgi:MFS family permease